MPSPDDTRGASTDCDYCGCDVAAHSPVSVAEGVDRDPAGTFCNYGCLVAYVEREGLATGTTC
ncbi:hypothetical protein [Halegenticoccus tardaugens]|uniref:hypothetical protein n=1 Tax=Halegenticoccus tardaugens TaxID=2071624 RepID=UPI00100A8B95|nr:hypothetical protein [Halegenticoccus tardaugens]